MPREISFYQHGTNVGYVYYMCRCTDCRRANTEYKRKLRNNKRKVQLSPESKHHGTINGYNNLLCRCDECCRAWSEYMKNWRLGRQ